MRPSSPSSIAPHILEQAADWLVRLNQGTVSDAERAACAAWRDSNPEHGRAWQRAEKLLNKLDQLPAALAMPALDRPANVGRRAALAKLGMLLAIIPGGLAAWRVAEWQQWSADQRTSTGERRSLALADGTRITLNSASAIDVQYNDQQRLVLLRTGEIMIETATDTAAQHRPFRVATAQGLLEALGTRFSVRQLDGQTHIAVLQGAVRIQPTAGPALLLQAGEQTWFSQHASQPVQQADESVVAWLQGMLLADDMRLGDFANELARYRDGMVRCDPAIAGLRISGAFPIADTDRALGMLAATYPVQTASRLNGYWLTLLPR